MRGAPLRCCPRPFFLVGLPTWGVCFSPRVGAFSGVYLRGFFFPALGLSLGECPPPLFPLRVFGGPPSRATGRPLGPNFLPPHNVPTRPSFKLEKYFLNPGNRGEGQWNGGQPGPPQGCRPGPMVEDPPSPKAPSWPSSQNSQPKSANRGPSFRIRLDICVPYDTTCAWWNGPWWRWPGPTGALASNPEPRARVRAFEDSGIRFQLLAWVGPLLTRAGEPTTSTSHPPAPFGTRGIEIPFPPQPGTLATLAVPASAALGRPGACHLSPSQGPDPEAANGTAAA